MSVKFRWETEFKETEIGEIPKDWEEKKVEAIGDIGGGTTPSTKIKNYWDGNIPWITPKDLANYNYRFIRRGRRNITEKAVEDNSLKIFPPGTVLLTSRAPIGYVSIAKNQVTTNQGFKNIVPNKDVNSEFLYYFLIHIGEYLKDISGGSTFDELTKEILKDVKISYPPLVEQSRIATVLSWIDDLIENKKRQNEILEKTAMGIFKSWFIDFEPFNNKEFEYNEELGKEIPKGWKVKPIGKIAEIRNGLSYSGKEKYEEPIEDGYIFITLNNAIEGGGFKPVYAWIKSERIKEHHFIEEGDLIIPNTEQTKDERLLGSPGIVFFPPNYNGKGVYSHHITKISPFNNQIKNYLYLFLKFTREDSASFHTGTGVLGLDINNFKLNKIVIFPPEPVLEKFNFLVEPLFQKIIKNQKEIMTLRKIQDTLLPLLVFGKLRVEEI
ncbi:MAG: restriction endonuclease subunit S [Candidatus Altiarchaeota archaeon]